jgi:septum site-determining protein MinC
MEDTKADQVRDSGGRRPGSRSGAFELKSRRFSLLGLMLYSADMAEIAADWAERAGQGGFEHEPVVIDLSAVPRVPAVVASESQAPLALEGPAPVDLRALVELLRASQLQPVAVAGATPEELALAHALGLADAADEPAAERVVQAPAQAQTVREVIVERVVEKIIEKPAAPAPTLIVDKPLRSGQRVYAKGGDLVVLALVNHGAEVIADGSVHVYAPLRGKAIAGARGDTTARIYAQSLEAELLSIAGIYRTAENPLPVDVAGKPAQVLLDGEKLLMQPLVF